MREQLEVHDPKHESIGPGRCIDKFAGCGVPVKFWKLYLASSTKRAKFAFQSQSQELNCIPSSLPHLKPEVTRYLYLPKHD